MKYNKLRIETTLVGGGLAACNIEFDEKCNVILTDSNTQGKSSIINSLAVGLGFEEIVKSNIAALFKDTIKIKDEEKHTLSSQIFLEIGNEKGEALSINRKIKPELVKGVSVRFSPLSEWNEDDTEEYFLGKDSYASGRGFHHILCDFIGFPYIPVISQEDNVQRLYLQYIFSALFIEQKRGWTDIMANIPYYSTKEPKKSTISEMLGLKYIKNNLRKNKLKIEVEQYKSIYQALSENLKQLVNHNHFSIKGFSTNIDDRVWRQTFSEVLKGRKSCH